MFKKTRHKTISRIIEDNLDYLVSFAYYRLGNHDEAEDLVYDAILKFLERDTDNIKLESIRLYIFRIVHNLCLDYARSDHKDLLPIENLDIGEGVDEALDLEDRKSVV